MSRITLFPLFLALMIVAINSGDGSAQTHGSIRAIIDDGPASGSFWSVIVTGEEGEVLEEYNGDKLIRPASVYKLMMSAAFLHELGPDYTYTTTLYGLGRQDGDTWIGDLIIEGRGDPTINGDFFDDPLFLFERWTRYLRNRGIFRIEGNIIGNESFFDDIPYPRGWEWDDLSYYYGVETNALSFNKNVVDLEVMTTGEIGTVPSIEWFPFNTPFVEFVNEQIITPPASSFEESYRRILGTNTIVLRSTLPQGYRETEPLSVTRPSLYFVDTFGRYLEREGIEVTGELLAERQVRDWEDPGYQPLNVHHSVPLHEILQEKNRNSDNFYAEMLLKTLAAERYSAEGSTELGIQAVENFLDSAGINSSHFRMRDGSGMAPANLLRASELNRLLYRLAGMDHFDVFMNSLSVAGEPGTLQYRFQGSPIRTRFRGKTGFMSGVRTLSGFLETSGGRQLIVTIATNNYTLQTGVVDGLHQQILEYLYSVY